jgi:hypothetical protein
MNLQTCLEPSHRNRKTTMKTAFANSPMKLQTYPKPLTQANRANEMTYAELLLTPQWQRKRLEILKRDAHQCRNCSSKSGLQVHHRQYRRFRRTGERVKPWQYEARLLITLCAVCHEAGHQQHPIATVAI